jgi:ribosome-associated protein YbcJ (S4-like RNA binding protein)
MTTKHEIDDALRTLAPALRDGRWVFVTFDRQPPFDAEIAGSIREGVGVAAVLAESEAVRLNLDHVVVWAWIECLQTTVTTAVGVTAALSTALADASIPCRVIAGFRGDHLFVPFDQREDALTALEEIAMVKVKRRPERTDAPRSDGIVEVAIDDGEIRLGQFLKLAGLVDSGAAVKPLLAYGRVQVNGESESRRGRRIVVGDVVTVDGRSVAVG